MAKKNPLEGKEIMQAGTGYVTVFPSFNAVFDGFYLQSFKDVLDKLEKPLQLDITSDDLKKLKDTDAKQALSIKFKNGGYECGASVLVKDLKTGDIKPSRATGTPKLKSYNMVVLDADGPKDGKLDANFDEKLHDVLGEYEYYAHSTISSTEQNKRRRIIIPLASPVTADVREATIRFIADKLGMQNVDKASKNTRQMMCFPVYTKDGEKYAYHNTGKLMNATEWLPAGWEDVSNWPKWADENKIKCNKTSGNPKKRLDVEQGEWIPCWDKNKLHYAYNCTYRISDVLKESGKYTQENKNRWSHTYDNAKGGIQVTNDSWLYSHYGNDCLSTGTPLDAYEAAIVLKFGSLDKDNWKKMISEVSRDEKVKNSMINMLDIDLPEDAESWAMMFDLSTEEGIAQVCMQMFPHKIRNGKWFRYSNGIYKEVKDVAMLQDVLQAIRVCSSLSPDNEALQGMVGKATNAKNVLQLWKSLATNNENKHDAWENKAWYLHFTDTIIDLKAWCEGRPFKVPFSPDYLLTQSCGYPFADVENVKPEAMDEFMKAMDLYLPDEDIRNYFQMAVGRSLTSVSASEDKCIWMLSGATGKDGGNGKSTLLGAIKGALGGDADSSYYYEIPGKYLYYNMHDSSSAETPTPMLAGARDRRFVNFFEYNGEKMLDGEKYKNYTSSGYIRARKLNSDSDSFRAKFCAFIDCNKLASLQKKEHAILRRTRVVPFDAELKAKGNIKERFLSNHDLHVACMVWMLLGLKMYFANGMQIDEDIYDKSIPKAVFRSVMEWYDSFDSPSDFFDERYIIDNNSDSFLVFEECFKEYQEQIFYRGATASSFRQAEARWLREHGLGERQKKFIPRLNVRRQVYVGVYLSGTTYCEGKKNVSVVNKLGNQDKEIPDDNLVKKDASEQNIFDKDDIKVV